MSESDGSPQATGQGDSPTAGGDPNARSVGGGNEPTIPLPAVRIHKEGSQLGRQITVWVAVGAVALLAIVSAVLGTGRGSDSAAEAAVEELSTTCAAKLIPLLEAVEEWQGIDNWAVAPSGSPDLLVLSLSAIEDLSAIETTSDLSVAAVALRRESNESTGDPKARAAALRAALTATVASLTAAPAPSTCQTPRLEAALTLG